MANTTNYNWATPDDTDLVKDGAAAIRTLGSSIDTSLVDLLGGTTGQVLSKTSGTDMDFTWVDTDDANAIQNAIVDAKGDLVAASGADTPARLAVGANDLLLTAASGEATGLKYTGGWTTWSPTYLNITVGNGTVIARYQKIGKTVNYFFRLTWGSTTSCGNYPIVSYPVTPSYTTYFNGLATLQDTGVGQYLGRVTNDSTNGLLIMVEYTAGTWNIDGVTGAATPATWTTGDIWTIQGSYEVA